MSNRLSCSRVLRAPATNWRGLLLLSMLAAFLLVPLAAFSDAPGWMHALVNAPEPAHDEKTDAILMYAEKTVSVQSVDKIRVSVREAYKIMRPGGREHGTVVAIFDSHKKITSMHGWCIPAQGKDYEVKEKDAVEASLPKIEGSELISDVKAKVLRIPAPDPGNIIGYEYEIEEQPMVLQNVWHVQGENPTRESHYTLQLPPGWEYRALWLNYPETKATQGRSNEWQWTVSDVKGVREEEEMPPLAGIEGMMVVSFFAPGGATASAFSNWQQMGDWYLKLTNGRLDGSPDLKKKVNALTASSPTTLDKMRAIAQFLQHDIRYVAIELGIGGFQPHPASEVFVHRYGDCKDKATLMAAMLHEIGVDSYYVVINGRRGAVTAETPAQVTAFNHMILAIRLPDGLNDPSLLATIHDPKLGTLLFFDPTNEITPFGQIGGYLQSNYGLLVTSNGSELIELPRQPSNMNSIERTGTMTLDAIGTLKGEVKEVRLGDRAWRERWALRNANKESDKIKPIETLLAGSLPSFRITNATVINLQHADQPFGFDYSFEATNYAKNAGDLLLVRARVVGVKSSGLMETKEQRKYPVEFDGPTRDADVFDITIPQGYQVDELPLPADADYSFASYHSKTAVNGNVIHYTRTFEIKELTVPVSQADELKKLYRTIASDERSMVVLKPGGK